MNAFKFECKKNIGNAAAIFGLSIFINISMIAPIIYMLSIYDKVMISGNIATLIILSLIYLFIYIAASYAEVIRSKLTKDSFNSMEKIFYPQVIESIFLKKPSPLDATKLYGDLNFLQMWLTSPAIFLVIDFIFVPVYVFLMFALSFYLGIASLLLALVACVFAFVVLKSQYKEQEYIQTLDSTNDLFFQSRLKSSDAIHVMGILNKITQQYEKIIQTQEINLFNLKNKQAAWEIKINLFKIINQVVLMGFSAYLVIDGQLSLVAMVATNFISARIISPFESLISSFPNWARAKKVVLEIISLRKTNQSQTPKLIFDSSKNYPFIISIYNLKINNATGKSLISSEFYQFEPGKMYAISGPSGCGKSAFLKTLLGTWPYSSGQVLINGKSIQDYDKSSYSGKVGYLSQRVELFDGTISQNIAGFGNLDYELIVAAAKKAGCHELILKMSNGYETQVGPQGALLSSGQRQIIAFARSIYTNPSFLCLDEPESNMDDVFRDIFYQKISLLLNDGVCVLAITHTPSLVKNIADYQINISQGHLQLSHNPNKISP